MSKETMSEEEIAAGIELIKSGEAARAVDAAEKARQPIIAELDDKLDTLRRQNELNKLRGEISRALENQDFTEVARLAGEAQTKKEDEYAEDHANEIAEGKQFAQDAAREIVQTWTCANRNFSTSIVDGMRNRSFYRTSGLHSDFLKPLEDVMGAFGKQYRSLELSALTASNDEIIKIRNNPYFKEIFGKAIETELADLPPESETSSGIEAQIERRTKLEKLKQLIL